MIGTNTNLLGPNNQDLQIQVATEEMARDFADDLNLEKIRTYLENLYNDYVSKGAGNNNAIGKQSTNNGPNNSPQQTALAASATISTGFALSDASSGWSSVTSAFNSFANTLGYVPGAENGQSVYGLDYMTGNVTLDAEKVAALEADKADVIIQAQEDSNLIAENVANGIVGPLSLENHYNATARMAGLITEEELKSNVETNQLERDGYVTLEDGTLAPTTGKLDSLSGSFKVADTNIDIENTGEKTITAVKYSNADEFNQSAHGVNLAIPASSSVTLSDSPNVQAFSFSVSGNHDITSPNFDLLKNDAPEGSALTLDSPT